MKKNNSLVYADESFIHWSCANTDKNTAKLIELCLANIQRWLMSHGYHKGKVSIEDLVSYVVAATTPENKTLGSSAESDQSLNGTPKHYFVYHGTPNSFDTFDTFPAFFASEYEVANVYAQNQYAREGETGSPRVISARLTMSNPKEFSGRELLEEFSDGDGEIDWYQFENYLFSLMDEGYDGVIIKGSPDYAGGHGSARVVKEYDQYIALNHDQLLIIDGDFKEFYDDHIRVYHGTDIQFDVFGKAQNVEPGDYGSGFYFTADKALAMGYAEKRSALSSREPVLVTADVSLKNPFVIHIDSNKTEANQKHKPIRDRVAAIHFTERLINDGYDGVIVKLRDIDDDTKEIVGEYIEEVVAFYPDQIRILETAQPATGVLINAIDLSVVDAVKIDAASRFPRLFPLINGVLDTGKIVFPVGVANPLNFIIADMVFGDRKDVMDKLVKEISGDENGDAASIIERVVAMRLGCCNEVYLENQSFETDL